ncbi:hypothetical protein VEGAS_36 [Paenibacillus phage Vegas]|uniref:Uncharacterized protein n=4 Tax=Vegasvirus vegas TaxID=2034999 RepID=A0A0K2CZH4_9CAUD|nr:hypothetical protein VEGAS_36 [Paenibacillus phage Vegas]ALA12733.1 hypothetical protein VEGAS_36 [Paenibacillus phage Vegas]ALA12817.1 hypothetical protein HAYLEY_34 [Paenibacillus phage Hayley]ALA12904.1 hypothetical protein VADIM_36 [Paenibacillus phage Vadim]ALA12992.1 hypothetical protein DIANE_36 [Paenibacillus phage Diane]
MQRSWQYLKTSSLFQLLFRKSRYNQNLVYILNVVQAIENYKFGMFLICTPMSPLGTNWGRNVLGITIIHSDTNRYEQEKPL